MAIFKVSPPCGGCTLLTLMPVKAPKTRHPRRLSIALPLKCLQQGCLPEHPLGLLLCTTYTGALQPQWQPAWGDTPAWPSFLRVWTVTPSQGYLLTVRQSLRPPLSAPNTMTLLPLPHFPSPKSGWDPHCIPVRSGTGRAVPLPFRSSLPSLPSIPPHLSRPL